MAFIEPRYLNARRVGRTYQIGQRHVVALQPISLSAKRGEFIALTGPSGSGKSTLLNLLSGLDRPSNGRITIGDQDLGSLDDKVLARIRNARFGFVFQIPHVLRNRTVRENIGLPIRYAPQDKYEHASARVEELIDYVGLSAFSARLPSTLSGGELQRLAFARALVLDPDVIFADEPTAALDDVNSHHLLSLLTEQAKDGKLIIIATHDPFAKAYAHREIRVQKVTNALA